MVAVVVVVSCLFNRCLFPPARAADADPQAITMAGTHRIISRPRTMAATSINLAITAVAFIAADTLAMVAAFIGAVTSVPIAGASIVGPTMADIVRVGEYGN
jgi:hypothetical protein